MRLGHSQVPTRLVLGAFLLLALACASATKRLEQGAELEQQGRYSEAAARYIQALRKDPSLPEARRALERVGSQAIAQNRTDAARFRTLGSFVQAADLYRSCDALVADATSVGVPLTVADGYAESRRTVFDEAIDQLLHTARMAEAQSQWAQAVAAYEQVNLYEPRPRHEMAVLVGRVRASVLWGETDLAAGHYRAAFEHAESALALLSGRALPTDPRGGDSLASTEPTWAERAQNVRDEALNLGTVHAALTPMRAGNATSHELPEGFLDALNDELDLRWTQPPLFVAVLDPLLVRRELRRLGLVHSAPSLRDAMRVGHNIGADYLVSLDMDTFAGTDSDVATERHAARTRAGADTTYTVLKGQRLYAMTAALVVLDVEHGREVRRHSFEVSESGRFARAEYDGDPRQLKLPDNERRLFDIYRQREQEQEIQDRLIDKAAVQLAAQVFDDLVSCVP